MRSSTLLTNSFHLVIATALVTAGFPAAPARLIGQETVVVEQDAATAPSLPPRQLKMSELQEARLIFSELDEQVRIAAAKLDRDALRRKRELGRAKALLEAVDQQKTMVAADLQRRRERHLQLCDELQTFAGNNNAERERLIERSQSGVQAAEQRLESLSRYGARLNERLSGLRQEHLHKLLEATVVKETPETDGASALEALLESELGTHD